MSWKGEGAGKKIFGDFWSLSNLLNGERIVVEINILAWTENEERKKRDYSRNT